MGNVHLIRLFSAFEVVDLPRKDLYEIAQLFFFFSQQANFEIFYIRIMK